VFSINNNKVKEGTWKACSQATVSVQAESLPR